MGRKELMLLRSTTKWAEKECMKWIKTCGYSKQQAVEMFIRKMDHYSTTNPHTSMIFSIAKDTALNVLDDMIMKGEAR